MSSRRQFTSCDPCRRSRLGCDAAKKPGRQCSNCVRRDKTCSLDWINRRKSERHTEAISTTSNTVQQDSDRLVSCSTSVEVSYAANTVSDVGIITPPCNSGLAYTGTEYENNLRQKALTVHYLLWDIFTEIFEPQLGLWIGNDCNPFRHLDTAPKTLISRLMVTLDKFQQKLLPSDVFSKLGLRGHPLSSSDSAVNEDGLINQALLSSVYAFTARWLPLDYFRKTTDISSAESVERKSAFTESIWSRAHTDVSHVMGIATYRSILALYLFGMTPAPPINSPSQCASLYQDIALRHFIQLRSRSRIPLPSPALSLHTVGFADNPTPETAGTSQREDLEYRHMEDTSYWFGIVFDTSKCVINCESSVLLPGATGDKKVWALVEQRIKDFDSLYRSQQSSQEAISDITALTILQHASSCKALCFMAINRVQDVLFYHTTDISLEEAIEKAVLEINRFEQVFIPWIDKLARDYLLLNDELQIAYFLLSLHFHLGALVLVDTLVTQQIPPQIEALFNILGQRLSSARAVVNLVNLILQTDTCNNTPSSLFLRDPYPEHTGNALFRAANSILSLYNLKLLPQRATERMATVLFSGLHILSQVSRDAAINLSELVGAYSASKLNYKNDFQSTTSARLVPKHTAMHVDTRITAEHFEDEVVKELGKQAIVDPSLLNMTIEREETQYNYADSTMEELQWIDFSSMWQNWIFEDCFASL